MDDFEKEYPGFDWKNTPAYKHPGGKDCPCPKHEYIREQINFTKQVNEKGKEASKITLKFCPDHYKVYTEEVIPCFPRWWAPYFVKFWDLEIFGNGMGKSRKPLPSSNVVTARRSDLN